MKLLAIDVGASSGRAIQGGLDGGKLSMKEVHRFKNAMIEVDGHKHWDIHALRAEMLACLTNADDDVEAIGIDTWGVDYGYVGKDGEVMGLPFAYRDDRNIPMIDEVHNAVGGDWLFGVNGLQVMPFNTVYQVAEDVKSRPEVLAEAERLQLMPELLGCLLTGQFVGEYSIASTSGLLDARTRTWSDELLKKLNIPRRLFTDISAPGEFQADLRPDVAEATGCKGKLIAVACHDTASAVAATPMSGPGAMYISSGTWSLAGVELDEPCISDAARAADFTNEGGVNNKIRFLKNVMGLWLVQELQRLWAEGGNDLGFGDICDEAAAAPAFGPIVDPNNQRFMAPQNMEREIQEECVRTGQPAPEGVGPLARCVFESLALAYRDCLESTRRITGQAIDRVHLVGGGTQNKLLNQMAASACGLPVHVGPVEATAIGNLLVQAISLGALADVHAAREVVKATFPLDEYTPEDPGAWQAAWERFQKLPA